MGKLFTNFGLHVLDRILLFFLIFCNQIILFRRGQFILTLVFFHFLLFLTVFLLLLQFGIFLTGSCKGQYFPHHIFSFVLFFLFSFFVQLNLSLKLLNDFSLLFITFLLSFLILNDIELFTHVPSITLGQSVYGVMLFLNICLTKNLFLDRLGFTLWIFLCLPRLT